MGHYRRVVPQFETSGYDAPADVRKALPTNVPAGYLDAATTEPLHPVAREALMAALDAGWADPGRLYRDARKARMLLDAARESVAATLGARPDEVALTASGAEADSLAITGLARGRARMGARVLASAVERSTLLYAARSLGPEALVTLAVDDVGRLDLAGLSAALGEGDVALLALQSANHEVGTRQPLAEARTLAQEHGVPVVVDAAHSIGHDPAPRDWDVLTADARLWGGPQGVGVMAVRTGVRWRSPGPETAHEAGRVPGPVNVPAVVAAAAALDAVEAGRTAESARLSALVDVIRARVASEVPHVSVLGDPTDRLPHIVTFSCLYVEGEALLGELDRLGFAVSSGSSCVSDSLEPSHVLAAMGALTHGNVRVSLPRGVAEADVHRFLDVLPDVVARVRTSLGVDDL